MGDSIGARGPAEPKPFTYLRYDVPLTTEGLRRIGCMHLDPAPLVRLGDVATLEALREVDAALGEAKVCAEHFAR